MIIDINEELFHKVKQIVKSRNLSIYEQLEEIKPLDTVTTDNTLIKAREVKTQRIAPADSFGHLARSIRTV